MSHSAVATVFEVMKLVRVEGPISNINVAAALELGPQTVRNVLAEAEANGIVVVRDGPKPRRGNVPKLYSISPAWRGKA